jgi:5'-nucleotidase
MRKRMRIWAAPLALAAIAIGVALAAPLASPNKASAGPIISGARSLSDRINVVFDPVPPGHTTAEVHLLAFNDLHGTLDPALQTLYGQFAGGAAYLAKAVKDKQAAYRANQVTLFAGDNIGASQLASALFHDEPTVLASNMMHVDLASVGNHEFDEGSAELLRIQNGGCHPTDGCAAAPYKLPNGGTTDTYPGADFQYLSTNVIVDATGKTLFPETAVKQFNSTDGKRKVKLGFIGETLEGTPTIVTPSGVAGLTFQDEADAANRAVAALAGRGVKIPILVIHQGGFQGTGAALNGCAGNLAGSDIVEIANRLDPAIKVIVSAHTHAEYRCTITTGGVTRLITSASSFGRVLSDITLTIDQNNDKLVSADATNILIRNSSTSPPLARQADPSLADPQVQAVVDQYLAASAPLANRVVGSVTETLLSARDTGGDPDGDGEAPLGNVIADSQLEATAAANKGGAVIAFMNPGGIRAPIKYEEISGGEQPGEVTYGELFKVQPFGNTLVVKTCTGAQIQALLEQQQLPGRILTVSHGFNYTWDALGASGNKVINSTVTLNGAPIVDTQSYRVEMNNFLASGGDGFTVFNACTDQLGGEVDLDALVNYFGAHSPISPPTDNRITRLN